jgi:hypothetical protein
MGLKAIIPFVLGFLNEAPTFRNKLLIPRPVCDEFCVIIK